MATITEQLTIVGENLSPNPESAKKVSSEDLLAMFRRL
jgi:hypothetical protein